MANYIQNNLRQGGQYTDTSRLGYKNIPGGGGVTWDDQYQNMSANPQTQPITNWGGTGRGDPFAPTGGDSVGTGDSLQGWIGKQMGENSAAKAKNQANWEGASSYLKGFANPLSPDVIARMKSENAVKAQGGYNNAYREQEGILNANGQGDSSSLAAAAAQAQRHSLGAQIGANTDLGIKAAQINNEAGRSVGNSIISNLPQYRGDDLSGLMALTLQQQNQDTQNRILENQYNSPRSPGSSQGVPLDEKYRTDKYGLGAGGGAAQSGFSFMIPPTQRPLRGNNTPWWGAGA